MRLTESFISIVLIFYTISTSSARDGGDATKSNCSTKYIGSYGMSWPNATIPYTIDEHYSLDQRNMIIKAMRTIQHYTCVRFVPYSGQVHYMAIENEAHMGCSSLVGHRSGRQQLSLEAPRFFTKIGYILHELLHALGFIDEHNREDRDKYVTINMENIKEDRQVDFVKNGKPDSFKGLFPYDYYSVMHYSEYEGSKNTLKTMVPKDTSVTIGQRDGLSRGDVSAINYIYNCHEPALTLINSLPIRSSRVLPNFGENFPSGNYIATAQTTKRRMTNIVGLGRFPIYDFK